MAKATLVFPPSVPRSVRVNDAAVAGGARQPIETSSVSFPAAMLRIAAPGREVRRRQQRSSPAGSGPRRRLTHVVHALHGSTITCLLAFVGGGSVRLYLLVDEPGNSCSGAVMKLH